jgi:hypothetical protein
MADQPMNPAVPQDGELNPALEQAQDAFTAPGAQEWSADVAKDIQQHLNEVNVADANQRAGEQLVQNMADTKDNLVGMVQSDPTSVNLALNLAPKLVGGMLGHMADQPDIQADTHSQITGHIQQAVAHAAVIRMADFHADGARDLLNQVSQHLGEGDADKLNGYIDTLQNARDADHAAGLEQLQSDRDRASQLSAYKVGSTLLDPSRESIGFPDNFVANLVRNTAITPADKQPLYQAFNNLRQFGDPASSDPHLVAQTLQQLASPDQGLSHADIFQHVGQGLKYVDALMLHGLNLGSTPEGLNAVKQLSTVVSSAQQQLAGSGTNVGDAAFGRFMDWLLPSYRRTGAAGLNPNSDNFLLPEGTMASFAPRHSDAVVTGTPTRSLSDVFRLAGDVIPLTPGSTAQHPPGVTGDLLDRMRELGITGYTHPGQLPVTMPEGRPGGAPANEAEINEDKLRRLQQLEQENREPIAPPSGNFYQRKLEEQQQKEQA